MNNAIQALQAEIGVQLEPGRDTKGIPFLLGKERPATNSKKFPGTTSNTKKLQKTPSLEHSNQPPTKKEQQVLNDITQEAEDVLGCSPEYICVDFKNECPQVFITEGFFSTIIFRERVKNALFDDDIFLSLIHI